MKLEESVKGKVRAVVDGFKRAASNSKFIEEEDSKFINAEGSSGVKDITIDGLSTSVAVHDYPCYGLHAMQRTILAELIHKAISNITNTTSNTVVTNPCFFNGYTRLVAFLFATEFHWLKRLSFKFTRCIEYLESNRGTSS